MQIVGQIIKGTVTVVDVYGKEQTLGKGQTIVLGDTVKAKSEDALILFDNNPEPVIIAGNTAIEIDDDFLAYLTDQAKKAQEGVETTLAEEVQNDDLQVFMDSEDESFLNDNTLTIENSSINSIELFDANIQGIDFNREVAAEEKASESNIQFSLVGEDGQYYVRGSDTETLMVIEHARDGTLSSADNDRHFEVLEVSRGSVPVETINTVLHHTRLDLQGTEDVPAVVQDVIDSLETWQTAGDLDAHDMTVLGIDHGTIHVTNINEALKNSDFYSTGTIDSFYPDTENVIATLQALQNGTAVSNEQLQDLGVLSSTQALSEGELGYLRTLMSDLTPSSDAYLTELTTQSNHLYTTAEAPTSIDLVEASDSGTSNEDNITKDNTPTVTIGLPGDVTPGIDTLNVHIRNHDTGKTETYRQTITQAEIDNGKVDITFLEEMIVDGHYTLSATITDSRGYTSTIQNIDINVDLKATVTVDTIAEDDIINAQEYEKPLTISGTSEDVEAGQKLTVTLNNHTYETTVQNNGKWQVTVPLEDVKGLKDKQTYEVSVNVTDLAGNEAVLETPHILRVNTSAEITIDKITGDNIINAQEHFATEGVEIHGTTTGIEEGQRVTVLIKDAEGNTVFTDRTAVSNVNDEEKGSWSYTIAHSDISGLSHTAAYTVEVLASDASGNEAPSVTQDIVIDIKADSDDNLGITLSDASDLYEENKTLSHDDQTNDKSPQMDLSGIDTDVKTVTVTFTDSANPPHTHPVSATQSDDGKWILPAEVLPGFQDGEITATVTVVDHVGNEDTASTTFTLDTRADNDFDPEVNDGLALSIALNDTSDNNDVNAVYNEEAQNGDKQTNDKSPQMDLSGIDLDVQTVIVTFTDSANHTQTVAATKNDDKTTWTLPAQELTGFQDGVVTAIVTVADDANNTSTASTTFTLDTSADTGEPLSLTLSTEADSTDFATPQDASTESVNVAGDSKTNDSTPRITLGGIDPDVIQVTVALDNTHSYTITRENADTAWDVTGTAFLLNNGNITGIEIPDTLDNNTYHLAMTVIDDAGNEATANNVKDITIDTQVNAATITQDDKDNWKLELDPDIIHIEINATINGLETSIGTAKLENGAWVITPTDPAAYTITGSIEGGFKVKDADTFPIQAISTIVSDDAGNSSQSSDSSLTAATVSLTEATNSGSNDDNITNLHPQFTIDLAGQNDLLSIVVKYADNGNVMASAHRNSVDDDWEVVGNTAGTLIFSEDGTTAIYTAPFNNGTPDNTYTYVVEIQDTNAHTIGTVKSTTFSVVYDTTDPVNTVQSMTFDEDTTGSLNLTNNTVPTDAHLGDKPVTITSIPEGWSIALADGSAVIVGTQLSTTELSQIQVTPPKDYYGTQNINYTVTDIANNSSTGHISIEVENVNDAPVISNAPDTVELTESNVTLTATGTRTVTDVDKTDNITLSVTKVEVKGQTTIDEATLQNMLTLSLSPTADNTKETLTWNFSSGDDARFDYLEAGETLELTYTVEAKDNGEGTLSDTNTVTVIIIGTNDAPTITINSTNNFTEDDASNAVGSTVATFTTSDEDTDTDSVTVTLSDTINYILGTGADAGKVLLTQAGLDLVNAGKDLPAFTLIPNDITVDGNTVDVDPAVTTSNDPLTIFEMNNVNDFTEDAANVVAGVEVTTVKTIPTDEDGGAITYTISDTTNYAIGANTGTVTLTAAGAAEVNAGNELPAFSVTATSANINGEGSSSATVTDLDPQVTTSNDPLTTFEMNNVNDFTEDAANVVAGVEVTTVKTIPTDEDGGAITYTISDTTNYAIGANTGTVTLTAAGAAEVNAGNELPAFSVTATSANINGEGSSSATVANLDPAVKTANDPLKAFEMNNVNDFTEDAANVVTGVEVTTVKTVPTDEDGGAITYSITQGNDNGYYVIDADSGTVTLTDAGAIYVNKGNDLPAFSVTATSANINGEGSSSATVANLDPAVKTANDPLKAFEMNNVNDFTEDAANVVTGVEVTTVKTVPTDEDGGAITYSITQGNDNGYYVIDADSGTVTLTDAGAIYVNKGNDLPAFSVTATSANINGEGSSSATVANLDPAVKTANDPINISVEYNSVTENDLQEGTEIATVTATDEDGQNITYSISNNPSIYYNLDTSTGIVQLTQMGVDYVTQNHNFPTLDVIASSTTGETSTSDNMTLTPTLTDNTPPSVKIESNITTTDTGIITYTFTFSEDVSGFDKEDINVSLNATKGVFTFVSNSEYTLEVRPNAGTHDKLDVSVKENVATDTAGHYNTAQSDSQLVYIDEENHKLDDDYSKTDSTYSYIDLGNGNDILELKDGYGTATNIDFGEGDDTLTINTTDSVDLSNIHNVEQIIVKEDDAKVIGTTGEDTVILDVGNDHDDDLALADYSGIEHIEVQSLDTMKGTNNDDTVILKSNDFNGINLSEGTDTVVIDTTDTIDLSKLHNIEMIQIAEGQTLTSTNIGQLIENTTDVIHIDATIAVAGDSTEKATLDKANFVDTNPADGIPDVIYIDASGNSTDGNGDPINAENAVYDQYTYHDVSGTNHLIQIDHTIDVTWQ